jgi:choline kinase/phosphatidylglycerophosphate synthase
MAERASDEASEVRPGILSAARPSVGVVLAAGRSERLSRLTRNGSKALIRLGGMTLVERAVRGLLACGLDEVVVVVGHQGGPVTEIVERLAPGRVHAVEAEGWEAGNGASLAAAEAFVGDDRLFLLVTVDHLFGKGALESLLAAGGPAVLVDPGPGPAAWGEGTRVHIEDGAVVAFGKELTAPTIDCGAFVLPAGIFAYQRAAEDRGDASLAGAVTAFASAEPLRAKPLAPGTWWHDVDTPDDVRVARDMLRRALVKPGDGPVSRMLNRPISTRISMALASLRPSPDLVSAVTLLLAAVAAWALAAGAGIAGGLLVHLTSVLDGVDGEVARLQLRDRPLGAFLDGIVDRLADAAIVAGLGVWALGSSGGALVVWLVVAAATGSILSMASKDRLAALGIHLSRERGLGYAFGGRDGRLLLVAVLSLLGQPLIALASVAATSGLALLLRALAARSTRTG